MYFLYCFCWFCCCCCCARLRFKVSGDINLYRCILYTATRCGGVSPQNARTHARTERTTHDTHTHTHTQSKSDPNFVLRNFGNWETKKTKKGHLVLVVCFWYVFCWVFCMLFVVLRRRSTRARGQGKVWAQFLCPRRFATRTHTRFGCSQQQHTHKKKVFTLSSPRTSKTRQGKK